MNVENAPKSGVSPSRPPIRDWFGVVRLAEKINASLDQHFWRWASAFMILFLACFDREGSADHIVVRRTVHASPGQARQSSSDHRLQRRVAAALSHHRALASPHRRQRCTCGSPARDLGLLRDDPLFVGVLPSPIAGRLCLRGVLAHLRARPVFRNRRPALWRRARLRGRGPACVGKWRPKVTGEALTIPLLAVCLALMVALHYYAIFFLVPLFLAEMVRWRASGRARLRHSGRHGAGAARSRVALRSACGEPETSERTIWAQPSLGAIAPFYERFLLPPLILGGLAVLVVALLRGIISPSRESTRKAKFAIA